MKMNLREIILGGQDGLVNVLGVVLGVSAATNDLKVIIISGLAAAFAESASMAAVAYTSTEASVSEYLGLLERQKKQIETEPKNEGEDVRRVFRKWGFENELLENATKKIMQSKEVWAKFMMLEELHMSKSQIGNPMFEALVVGFSSLVGSIIPLLPFFLFRNVSEGVIFAIIISACSLFITGFIKAKLTVGNPFKSGLKLFLIGMIFAFLGYLVGMVLGKINI